MLELIELEGIAPSSMMLGSNGGQVHRMNADEQASIGIFVGGAPGGGRPDLAADPDRGFEDVEGLARGVEGGTVVVERPAAIVKGNPLNRLWRRSGKLPVSKLLGQPTGKQRVVVLGE